MADEKRNVIEGFKVILLAALTACAIPASCSYMKAERVNAVSNCMVAGRNFDWCNTLFKTGAPPLKEIEHLQSEREKLKKAIEAYQNAKSKIEKKSDLSGSKRLVSDLNLPDPPPPDVEPGSANDPCMQKCAEGGLAKGEKGKCYLECHDWRRLCLNDKELIAYEEALEKCLVNSKDPLMAHEDCEHTAAIENCW